MTEINGPGAPPTDTRGAAPAPRILRSLRVLGVRVDDIAPDDIVAHVVDTIRRGGRTYVVNANAHLLTVAQENDWVQGFYDRANIAFCDGAGVQFVTWARTRRRPYRTTPPEWVAEIARQTGPEGRTVFWLGGSEDAVTRAAAKFEQQTGMRSVGHRNGFFDHHAGSEDNRQLVEQINAASPDLLLLNMGMPLQERWLHDHWHLLNVRAAITAGALVDHAAGRVRRPPRWVADIGLEWAVRLAIEPKRLWRRYLLGLPRFGGLVLRETLLGRSPRGSEKP
ncbi:WecB/TagA/CpsF family glycosyltransferase [Roseomonas sp. GCM10028921]